MEPMSNKAMSSKENEDSDGKIVAAFKDADIVLIIGSIKRLGPDQEIDDDLMDFGIYYLLQDLREVVYVRAFAWDLYIGRNDIQETHKESLYKIITKRGKDTNLLQKRFIIIPVHNKTHWYLAIICNPFPKPSNVTFANERIAGGDNPLLVSRVLYRRWTNDHENPPMIFILDSLHKNHADETLFVFYYNATSKLACRALRNIHEKFWKETGTGFKVHEESFSRNQESGGELISHYVLKVPTQTKGFDCGIFCIEYAKQWFLQLRKLDSNIMRMKIHDCSDWFDPKILPMRRQALFQKVVEYCKKDFPDSLDLLLKASPRKTSQSTK